MARIYWLLLLLSGYSGITHRCLSHSRNSTQFCDSILFFLAEIPLLPHTSNMHMHLVQIYVTHISTYLVRRGWASGPIVLATVFSKGNCFIEIKSRKHIITRRVSHATYCGKSSVYYCIVNSLKQVYLYYCKAVLKLSFYVILQFYYSETVC